MMGRTLAACAEAFTLASLFIAGSTRAEEHRAQAGETFSDPFAYCQAVGNVDRVDERYAGERLPDVLQRALLAAEVVGEGQPVSIDVNLFWRCMDASLYACNAGANLPCMAKADTSREPSLAMREYCGQHPGEDMPAAATGRETVFTWRCDDEGSPLPVRQNFTPDARGFLDELWSKVPPPGTP